MKINGWEMENGRAAYHGTDGAVASVSWVGDVPGMVETLRNSGAADRGALSDRAEEAGAFGPGLYLRIAVGGNPSSVILLPPESGPGVEDFARENPAREFVEQMLAVRHQSMVAGRPMEPEELAGWLARSEGPNCPGRERFLGAMRGVEELIRANPADVGPAAFRRETGAERDVSAMISWKLGLEYHAEAARLLEAAARRDPGEANLWGVLSTSLWTGDTELTMGIMLRRPVEGGGLGYGVGVLSRDPDWMGMCPVLAEARGMEATVLGSRAVPGEPGAVIIMEESNGESEAPAGGTAAVDLLRALRDSGVIRCRWR